MQKHFPNKQVITGGALVSILNFPYASEHLSEL